MTVRWTVRAANDRRRSSPRIKSRTLTGSLFRRCAPYVRTRKRLRIGYNSESFSTKSTFSGGINRIYDEIPHAWDEIRLDGGWVDLISSKLGLDFICHRQISSRSDFIIAFL